MHVLTKLIITRIKTSDLSTSIPGKTKPRQTAEVDPVNWKACQISGINEAPINDEITRQNVRNENLRISSESGPALGKINPSKLIRSEKFNNGNTSIRWTAYPTRMMHDNKALYGTPRS